MVLYISVFGLCKKKGRKITHTSYIYKEKREKEKKKRENPIRVRLPW